MWEINAKAVEEVYGGFVDWDERFYNCPECGEPIYECDWTAEELGEIEICRQNYRPSTVLPICFYLYVLRNLLYLLFQRYQL